MSANARLAASHHARAAAAATLTLSEPRNRCRATDTPGAATPGGRAADHFSVSVWSTHEASGSGELASDSAQALRSGLAIAWWPENPGEKDAPGCERERRERVPAVEPHDARLWIFGFLGSRLKSMASKTCTTELLFSFVNCDEESIHGYAISTQAP
jgi:hypothetical protein